MASRPLVVVRYYYYAVFVFFTVFGMTGCLDVGRMILNGKNQFQSDVPVQKTNRISRGIGEKEGVDRSLETPVENNVGTATSDSNGADATSKQSASNQAAVSAERAIQEADVVQIADNRLYALSRWSGLNIIDISTRDQLRILGRFDNIQQAEPFEMYIRDGVVMIMFSGWSQYVYDEAASSYVYAQTSKIIALDVADPANIQEVGSFDIPGAISDSRVVGNVAYIVSYQNGYCWRCEKNQPLTAVVSLDIADPRQIQEVDELRYVDDDNAWGWNRRSITVTAERMYVAGVEYGENGPAGSTIKVVDITDPSGQLVEGADIQAAGQISSRWQMDEYEGVLRVISQPPQWDLSIPPVVQTFRVISSQQVEALGKTELKLPRPEQLQSVRFDGPRAYAITFERVDPLLTVDLSDPAAPIQAGQLEMPGWVYHMEPRGDRVVALGFDQQSALGAITVSLFNVADLGQPQMVARVNFGGDWAWLPEDQDRIHKVFRVFDQIGLILVPYSGNKSSSDNCYRESSGVQLVDFTKDTLALRGNAASNDQTRRALLHDTRLLTVSDQSVNVFNVDDRDHPAQTASLAIAQNVTRMEPLASGLVARFSQSYGSGTPTIDFVAQADIDKPEAAIAKLDMNKVFETDAQCNSNLYVQDSFVKENTLFIYYQLDKTNGASSTMYMGVIAIDTSDPSHPQVASKTEWELGYDWWIEGVSGNYGLLMPWEPIVHTQHAIVAMEVSYYDSETQQSYDNPRKRLRIIDITDQTQLQSRALPLVNTDSYTSVFAKGDLLLASRYETIEGNSGAVRYYLDRVDLSQPSQPQFFAPINVPGSVFSYDGESSRALTSDLLRVDTLETTHQECAAQFATFTFSDENTDTPEGTCTGYQTRIHLVSIQDDEVSLLDSYEIATMQTLSAWALGKGVLFGALGNANRYFGKACIGFPCGENAEQTQQELLVLSGLAGDTLRATVTTINSPGWSGWSWTPGIYASGTRAFVVGTRELAVLNANDPAKLAVERIEPLYSNYVSDLDITSNAILLSLGTEGAQAIPLSQ